MPAETISTNGHRESIRKFKLYLSVYMVSMLVLTPIWVVTQYEIQDGWLKHLSTRSRYPGDWDPWIIWVALVGAVIVAVVGIRALLDRPENEARLTPPHGTGALRTK